MQLKQIPKQVQETLFNRIQAINRSGTKFDPLNSISNTPGRAVSSMLTKSVWARAVASVPIKMDPNFTGPPPAGNELFNISSAFVDKNPIKDPLTSTQNLYTDDAGAIFRGHSGITSISTQFTSAAMQNVDIEWVLWDVNRFEDYRNAFLKHGVYVVVEFGYSTPNITSGASIITAEDMTNLFAAQQKQTVERGGNYCVVTGKIVDFSFKVGNSGEYRCNTKLVAMGNDIFNSTIENSEDKRPVKIKLDAEQDEDNVFIKANIYFESALRALDSIIRLDFDDKGGGEEALNHGVYHDGERGYCNWGWFEDRILNTFFGTTADFVGDVNLTTKSQDRMASFIRSIDAEATIIGEVGDVDSDGNSNFRLEYPENASSTKCRNHPDLQTLDLDVIIPGYIKRISDINEIVGDESNGFQAETIKKYKQLTENLSKLNRMPRWEHDKKTGKIRNFVFSASFLQSTFGGEVSNLRRALKSHWDAVSSRYNSIWNFKIVSDVNEPNLLVVTEENNPGLPDDKDLKDMNAMLNVANKSTPTDYEDKTFVFNLYGKDCLMKNFDLEVMMNSQHATMAAFHSNKDFDIDGDVNLPTVEKDSLIAFGYLQNSKLGDNDEETENKNEQVVKNAKNPYQLNKQVVRVGTDNEVSDLSLQNFDRAISKLLVAPDNSEKDIEKYIEDMTIIQSNEEVVNELDDGSLNYVMPSEDEPALIYDMDGNTLSVYKRILLSKLGLYDSKGRPTYHPLIPIKVNFTIAGIGGLLPFQLFQIDYLPDRYRKYVLFQIQDISHSLTKEGWSTTVSAIMRVDMDTMNDDIKKNQGPGFEEKEEKKVEFNSIDYVKAAIKIQNTKKKQEDEFFEDEVEEEDDKPWYKFW